MSKWLATFTRTQRAVIEIEAESREHCQDKAHRIRDGNSVFFWDDHGEPATETMVERRADPHKIHNVETINAGK